MPQGRSFHRTVDRNDPGAPAALPPHFPRAATHQGRRCVSSAPVAPCRGGPHSTWPGQATCAAVLAQGASPPRRTPTPRSFGRPAPFVCRSPGQRPTHSLKGSVSEAPAHALVLLGGACGGGGLNRVRLPLARAAAWKDVGGPMSKYGPQNSWLFCSLNNIPDGVTACADLVLQTT